VRALFLQARRGAGQVLHHAIDLFQVSCRDDLELSADVREGDHALQHVETVRPDWLGARHERPECPIATSGLHAARRSVNVHDALTGRHARAELRRSAVCVQILVQMRRDRVAERRDAVLVNVAVKKVLKRGEQFKLNRRARWHALPVRSLERDRRIR